LEIQAAYEKNRKTIIEEIDRAYSTAGRFVFNRTVGLRDSWAKGAGAS
jgi:hypothetical protein